jgi:GAF domain-containing protein
LSGDDICRDLEKLKSEGGSFGDLLEKAVELLHNSDERFHWTGIYELFPDNVLRLGPFIGPPTDHVFISVGKGICGSAVAEKRNKNVPDVSKETNYLACSTSTRSELVVLIREDDEIFAQIDIDSDDIGAFDEATEREVEKVARWLAGQYATRRKTTGTKDGS